MTDRELLEAAAKAAGIEGPYTAGSNGEWVFHEPRRKNWNPLTDDGDALRLAVKLLMNIDIFPGRAFVHCPKPGGAGDYDEDEKDGDTYAATRRVIVRAAAEIGRPS